MAEIPYHFKEISSLLNGWQLPIDTHFLIFNYLDNGICGNCSRYMPKDMVPIHKICNTCLNMKINEYQKHIDEQIEKLDKIKEQIELYTLLSKDEKTCIETIHEYNYKNELRCENEQKELNQLDSRYKYLFKKLETMKSNNQSIANLYSIKIDEYLIRIDADIYYNITNELEDIKNRISNLNEIIYHVKDKNLPKYNQCTYRCDKYRKTHTFDCYSSLVEYSNKLDYNNGNYNTLKLNFDKYNEILNNLKRILYENMNYNKYITFAFLHDITYYDKKSLFGIVDHYCKMNDVEVVPSDIPNDFLGNIFS
jgi:DNA repair exonuclease SbcCD ATPase subunit